MGTALRGSVRKRCAAHPAIGMIVCGTEGKGSGYPGRSGMESVGLLLVVVVLYVCILLAAGVKIVVGVDPLLLFLFLLHIVWVAIVPSSGSCHGICRF